MEGDTLIEQEKEKIVYDVVFVAPTVNEGKFVWEGTIEEARNEFISFLNSNFEEGSTKILSFTPSEDQQMDLPFPDNQTKTIH